jgi:hypothetical protein
MYRQVPALLYDRASQRRVLRPISTLSIATRTASIARAPCSRGSTYNGGPEGVGQWPAAGELIHGVWVADSTRGIWLKVDAMGLMDEGKLGTISAELQCQARQGFPGTVMLVKVAQLDCLNIPRPNIDCRQILPS